MKDFLFHILRVWKRVCEIFSAFHDEEIEEMQSITFEFIGKREKKIKENFQNFSLVVNNLIRMNKEEKYKYTEYY